MRPIYAALIASLLVGLFAGPVPGALAEAPECSDGIDNEGDGWTDYPEDAGCSSPGESTEIAEPEACEDGIDNDDDGLIDHPEDPECYAPEDSSETNMHGDPECAFNPTGCDGMFLRYNKDQGLFVGAVGDVPRCMYERRVKVKKVRQGADQVVARILTDDAGRFRRARPNASGSFFAVAPRRELEGLICTWRRTNSVQVGR